MHAQGILRVVKNEVCERGMMTHLLREAVLVVEFENLQVLLFVVPTREGSRSKGRSRYHAGQSLIAVIITIHSPHTTATNICHCLPYTHTGYYLFILESNLPSPLSLSEVKYAHQALTFWEAIPNELLPPPSHAPAARKN